MRKNGEPFFREIEEKITLKILKNKRAVIALGGGAFMNNQIRLKDIEILYKYMAKGKFKKV